ncbi:MAG: hypothetical protein LBR23_02940 [Spirochaetaceae bacterium]|nr:hypothetical protein [Spirochaetaceae bacterium]
MMRKNIFYCLMILLALPVFAQKNESEAIAELINCLGKPVPNGYRRGNRTTFVKDTDIGTMILGVENGVVVSGSIAMAWVTSREASKYLSAFYDLLEKEGVYQSNYIADDVYKWRGAFVIIPGIMRREDGGIVAGVFVVKDLNRFY